MTNSCHLEGGFWNITEADTVSQDKIEQLLKSHLSKTKIKTLVSACLLGVFLDFSLFFTHVFVYAKMPIRMRGQSSRLWMYQSSFFNSSIHSWK